MRSRRLIVNADDLGQSVWINKGIAEAVDNGIVTSASLMVRQPAVVDAATWAATQQKISIGLHVDLGEWICRNGTWSEMYRFVDPDDAGAVEEELSLQLELFRQLIGRAPTHLDSHQHVHQKEPLRSMILAVAEELSVPVRAMSTAVTYCGSFYGQWGGGN